MLTSRPTHGGGAPFGIDLEAGVAKITVRRPASVSGAPEEPEQQADHGSPADVGERRRRADGQVSS